jgi:hypothetical protein
MKYGSFFAAIVLTSSIVVGCGGESEQEKYNRMKNQELGQRQQLEQLEADKKSPEPTPEPEPTEKPTPIPRDSNSDTIYTPQGKFSVTYGKAEMDEKGILIYKTIEVEEGEDPQDIIWLMPSGVIVVTDKYHNRVRKVQ